MKNKIKVFLSVSLTVCMAFFLQGCGGGGGDKEKAPAPIGAAAFVAGTHPRFDPVISDLPFNTDLIFANAAATDGTAHVGDATDAVRATLNVLDGFSTSAYFDVMVEGSVNPATVVASQTVFLIQLNTGTKDALNPVNVVGVIGPAAFDAKVVSLDGGTNNVIRIRPTLPLKSKAKYLVVLTNDIKDTDGAALTRSWTYNALHDSTYPILDSLVPVRNAIKGWETLAAGFLSAVTPGLSASAATEKLTLTYTFTTSDPQAPLIAMASPRAAIVSQQVAGGIDLATAVGNVIALDNAGLLPTPKKRPLSISPFTAIDLAQLAPPGALAFDIAKLYTGYIKLPYYQTVPGTLPFGAFLTKNWTPDKALAAALGTPVPADVNGSFNVTYRYPFAAKTTDESVPLQVTLPEKTVVPGYAGALNCGQIYALSGYPTVIYVHGITSDRSSVIGLGHTLANNCIATVAIDLPLHGVAANNPAVGALNVEKAQLINYTAIYGENAPHERHFNVAGAGAPAPMNFGTPTSSDGSGAQFTNLGYLANTRDNNREGVIDLLNLNASLKGINEDFLTDLAVSLDLNNVHVVGVSLGGILSTVFTSVNQSAIKMMRMRVCRRTSIRLKAGNFRCRVASEPDSDQFTDLWARY